MAPAYRHTSGRSLVLSLLCLQIACLRVASAAEPAALTDAAVQTTAATSAPSTSSVTPSPASAEAPPQPSPSSSSPPQPPKCDRTFVSQAGGAQNGTFHAPSFVNPRGHSRQCLYTFIAGPGQRVEIVFTNFALRGTPPHGSAVGELPQCVHEYMDVYAEVVSPEPAELINSPFGGRYCGPIPPRRRVSLYRAIALGFYTDKNHTSADLFAGRYVFINDSEYEVGTPVSGTPCSFIVHAYKKRTGVILSPTYPGAYPKALTCTYQFLGQPGQRVRLEFRDFDLFFGGPHCPFDYVKVYDGPDNATAVIGTYCGQQRNLVLYSSESSLFVTFFTLARTANTQNRGFKGIFEFSESFVKLDFISKNDGEHIRGSECDQKILSKKESTGYVFSPNYPFPYIPKIVCRYFIYGMQDSQHLERVRLEFVKFEIPKHVGAGGGGHGGGGAGAGGGGGGGGGGGDSASSCTDGYLKVYLKGQEATDSYDKFDHELCGDESRPAVVLSDGPRLVMVFSGGELQGRGFKARYTFETEYRIPGTPAPDGTCSFTYRSTSRKRGEFNSPRYPSNYPSDTNCTYLFVATPNEQVTVVFDNFKVRADLANATAGSYGAQQCQEDWLEMYNVYRDGGEALVGRYCGMTAPGPIDSNRGALGLKLVLHADAEAVYSGFKARYVFDAAKSVFGDCGNNVTSADAGYGVISSPGFPDNYDGPGRGLASKTCNWYVSVRPAHRVLLNFERFAVEGDPNGRGCPAAVLRLWHTADGPPLELCGEKSPAARWQYLSETNALRLSFVTADKAVGAQGFRAVWTEVEGPPPSEAAAEDGAAPPPCEHFRCRHSGFCISDKLRCNLVDNCGADDSSDEAHCTVDVPPEDYTVLIAAVSAACVTLLLALCLLCHRKRRRRRRGLHRPLQQQPPAMTAASSSAAAAGGSRSLRQQQQPPPPPPPPPPSSHQHVCDELGERFASVDSV